MRLLVVHNFYLNPGGEDQVFRNEVALLRDHGHDVYVYTINNEKITKMSKVPAAINTVWSWRSFKNIKELVTELNPDLVHFHNTFPLLSPSVYFACHSANIPVVQSLHNYRLLCPSALFFKHGKTCTRCLGLRFPWPGIWHACYRNSYGASFTVALMLLLYKWLSRWKNLVNCYIALSEFSRQKFIHGGIAEKRIFVKPNFINVESGMDSIKGDYAVFVGRISEEKGIDILLRAWGKNRSGQLLILGSGPQEDKVRAAIRNQNLIGITLKGQISRNEVISTIANSQFLIVPSLCFENFPMVIIEAYACGVPVIASRLGAMAEIVLDRKTGLLFTAGDAKDLIDKLRWAWDHPHEMRLMGRNGQKEFKAKYTTDTNYQMLMYIYQRAFDNHR